MELALTVHNRHQVVTTTTAYPATSLPRQSLATVVAPRRLLGDEGGIVCEIDFGLAITNAVFASITHLRFDPRLPLAREITTYQKHRVKRLQRQAP